MLAGSFPAGTLRIDRAHRQVIFASSFGTVFEWYDFFLYGSLAAIIAKQFFAGVNETTGFLFALLAFAAGFSVRPFGALVFGRLGDLVGRKSTFLVTILIMGTLNGPGRPSADLRNGRRHRRRSRWCCLRLASGARLGGEYGGAADLRRASTPRPASAGSTRAGSKPPATLGLFAEPGGDPRLSPHDPVGRTSTAGAGAFPSLCRFCCWPSRCISASSSPNPRCSWR